ncbi:hypothetical protein CASFOL_023717 [Castilleja foliolosa]|uniref:Peptidyl-tRNA hydrolase n=1 Tax=Castilleja foliolosa TaxID=1961234 RepID=A0ABD3CLB0_9LAMI
MLLSRLSKRCFCTFPNPRPWLIVGLGNPGDKFTGTRHNVGFEMIDALAKSLEISMDSVHCKAIFGKGVVDGVPVFLAKPQTYMNLSGESSGPLAAYYKLPLNRVLVLHDDMDLPCGVLRLNPLGNHGRHNGLKNVIYHFRQNREFPRLRIGIGRQASRSNGSKSIFTPKVQCQSSRENDALREGVEALKQVLTKGLTESSRSFNRDQKYKHIRVQTMPV